MTINGWYRAFGNVRLEYRDNSKRFIEKNWLKIAKDYIVRNTENESLTHTLTRTMRTYLDNIICFTCNTIPWLNVVLILTAIMKMEFRAVHSTKQLKNCSTKKDIYPKDEGNHFLMASKRLGLQLKEFLSWYIRSGCFLPSIILHQVYPSNIKKHIRLWLYCWKMVMDMFFPLL